jgi:hypothetical protein
VLTGTGFTGATVVSFCGVAAASFVVDSDTQITATTGAADPLTDDIGDIVVTTPVGTSTLSNGFTYTSIQYAARLVSATCTVHDLKSGLTLNGGTNASALDDTGDTDFDLVQGSALLQPAYDATGGPNSQPSIRLTAADQLVDTSATGVAAGTGAWVMVVMKAATAASDSVRTYVVASTASNANAVRAGANTTAAGQVYDGTSVKSDAAAALSNDTWCLVDGYITTTGSDLWTVAKDGTPSGSPTALAAGTQGAALTRAAIGANPDGTSGVADASFTFGACIWGYPSTAAMLVIERFVEERTGLTIASRTF